LPAATVSVELTSVLASGESPPESGPQRRGDAAHSSAPPALRFEDVYEAHVDFVWRMVCRLGLRDQAAEDAVQEVFLAVHRRLADFEGRSSVKTWLIGILRRVLLARRRSMRHKALDQAPAPEAPADLDALEDATTEGPHERAAHAETVRLLYELLDRLDEDKREVFVLVELEQMPVVEVAAALGLNVSSVHSRLRLAREKFDAALARHRARDGWRSR
jgi:RNA polymerase sigma-70 factor (ECF subfamily)